jgi:hypothetical protein
LLFISLFNLGFTNSLQIYKFIPYQKNTNIFLYLCGHFLIKQIKNKKNYICSLYLYSI